MLKFCRFIQGCKISWRGQLFSFCPIPSSYGGRQDYSLAHGPFWFFDTSLADDEHKFIENMNSVDRELQRSKEDFIKEHRRNYDKPVFPPAWKTLELASFGTLSKLYYNFSDKKLKERSTPYQPFWVKEMERSWSI